MKTELAKKGNHETTRQLHPVNTQFKVFCCTKIFVTEWPVEGSGMPKVREKILKLMKLCSS